MGNNNLQADPNGQNTVSIINDILGSQRGSLFPRKTNGQIHTGGGVSAPNLGSPATPFNTVYVDRVVVGGAPLNLASLVKGTTVSVFTASDRSFSWPYGQASALAIIAGAESGGSGGGGGEAVTNFNPPNRFAGLPGSVGGGGGASTIIYSNITYTSGSSLGGRIINSVPINNVSRGGPSSAHGGDGGDGGVVSPNVGGNGLPGEHGYQSVQTHFINGLFTNAIMNIDVSQAVGAGGAGGAGGLPNTTSSRGDPGDDGLPGDNGALLGYVILIPIGV